jgi:hypothetical protein
MNTLFDFTFSGFSVLMLSLSDLLSATFVLPFSPETDAQKNIKGTKNKKYLMQLNLQVFVRCFYKIVTNIQYENPKNNSYFQCYAYYLHMK